MYMYINALLSHIPKKLAKKKYSLPITLPSAQVSFHEISAMSLFCYGPWVRPLGIIHLIHRSLKWLQHGAEGEGAAWRL